MRRVGLAQKYLLDKYGDTERTVECLKMFVWRESDNWDMNDASVHNLLVNTWGVNPSDVDAYISSHWNEYKGIGWYVGSGDSSQDFAVFGLVRNTGNIRLQKASANASLTDGSPSYDLSGAVYDICGDKACTKVVGVLVTNSQGTATSAQLDVGTYYVRERKAPHGYKLDGTVKSVTVPANGTGTVTFSDEPVDVRGSLSLYKVDADGTTSAGLTSDGYATTVGAELTVSYYAKELDTAYWDSTSTSIPDGTYYVESLLLPTDSSSSVSGTAPMKAGANVLDVSAASTEDGANVQVWYWNGSKAQQWAVTTNSDGTRSLAPQHAPGMRLDVKGGTNGNGVNVQSYTSNSTNSQEWYLNADGGAWQVLSRLGRAMDVLDGKWEWGTNVQTWDAHHNNAQKWHFVSTTCKVRFDANGGTGSMEDQEFAYGEQKALSANAFENGDREFLGWASTPDATKATVLDGSSVYATEVDGNQITLYAVWSGDGRSLDLPEAPTRTWTFRTVAHEGADGQVEAVAGFQYEGSLVDGSDEPYRASDGTLVVPRGTLAVQETKAPAGYELSDGSVHYAQVYQSGGGDGAIGKVGAWSEKYADVDVSRMAIEDKPKRHSFGIAKLDAETGTSKGTGSSRLGGATFEVRNVTPATDLTDGSVNWGGDSYATGSLMATVTTGEDGTCLVEGLPAGSYEVRETGAPEGHAPDDTPQTVEFAPDEDAGTTKTVTFSDAVIRHDTSFTKSDDWGRPMAGVAFVIRSKTTGEWHVAVTDDNGAFTTEASVRPHTTRTNASDAAVTQAKDGTFQVTDETKLDAGAGMWFGSIAPDDSLGALPWDEYEVVELSSSANVVADKAGNVTWTTSEERPPTDTEPTTHEAVDTLNKYALPLTGSRAAPALVALGLAVTAMGAVAWTRTRRPEQGLRRRR